MKEFCEEFDIINKNIINKNIKIHLSFKRRDCESLLIIKLILSYNGSDTEKLYEIYLSEIDLPNLITFMKENLKLWDSPSIVFPSSLYSNSNNNLFFYTPPTDFSPIFFDEVRYELSKNDPLRILISIRENNMCFFSFTTDFFYREIQKIIFELDALQNNIIRK